ncbi:MAG: NTP transferase domain-containing protein [Kiloniellaceae bacterium]
MIFGPTPLDEAEGAILAHSLNAGSVRFKKGRTLSSEDVAALRRAGVEHVVAGRLEEGDVAEDAAAAALAEAIRGDGLSATAAFTGRANLIVESRGVLVVDRERLDALNLVDETVTVATLTPYDLVEPRQMAATVKVIPFAVPGAMLERCLAAARRGDGPLLRVAALRPRTVGLVQTTLRGMKESLLDKTRHAVDARLVALDCPTVEESRCRHDEAAVADAIQMLRGRGCAIVLVSGASAIVDRRDVVPAGIVRAGGAIDHFGMPVDPGNLILLAHVEDTPVLGLPGCARSPKPNGFDWVLQRLIADLPVGPRDVMRMGAGGLLKEIAARPLPRAEAVEAPAAGAPRAPRVAAVVLAAGQSRRMGRDNKLLCEVAGKPMVVRAVEQAFAAKADPVVVVTGHEREKVEAALSGLGVARVHNPDYAAGLSTSLHRGLAALPPDIDGVVICLGDMPQVTAAAIDRLIAAFNPLEGRAICVPTWRGKRGNPVLFARRFVPEMQSIAGDIGARHLLGEYPEVVCEVAMDDVDSGDGVLLDVDTPEALAALRPAG